MWTKPGGKSHRQTVSKRGVGRPTDKKVFRRMNKDSNQDKEVSDTDGYCKLWGSAVVVTRPMGSITEGINRAKTTDR